MNGDHVPASSREIAVELQSIRELMAERDRRYEDRFQSQESAVLKYNANAELWRASANEWRAAMTDREARFAGSDEMDSKFEAVNKELASLKETRSQHQGRSELSAPLLIAISSAFGGLVVYIIQRTLGSP